MNEVFIRRAIGALVLFLGLFILAALLPGTERHERADADASVKTVRFDLRPEQIPTPVRAPSVVPEPLVDLQEQAVPAQSQAEPGATPTPKPEIRKPAPTRTPAAEAIPPSPAPAVGEWRVQAASFSNRENAERVIGELRATSLRAYRESATVSGRVVHRVIIGPYADKAAAERAQAAAVRHGFADSRVQFLGG